MTYVSDIILEYWIGHPVMEFLCQVYISKYDRGASDFVTDCNNPTQSSFLNRSPVD